MDLNSDRHDGSPAFTTGLPALYQIIEIDVLIPLPIKSPMKKKLHLQSNDF